MLKRFLARFGLGTTDAVQPGRPRPQSPPAPARVPPGATPHSPPVAVPHPPPSRPQGTSPARKADAGPSAAALARLPAQPYGQAPVDLIYNLLFCDDAALFGPDIAPDADSPLAALRSEPPDVAAIEAIALDARMESRVRALAFNRLRELGRPVPPGEMLGVVIEVPLEAGLDTLAVYVDHRIHYIDHAGRLSVSENPPTALAAKADELLQASRRAMQGIGPWEGPRLPPPAIGSARMTFVASDGLYFGEGPFDLLMREPLAAPIIRAAGELLEQVVNAAVGDETSRPPR